MNKYLKIALEAKLKDCNIEEGEKFNISNGASNPYKYSNGNLVNFRHLYVDDRNTSDYLDSDFIKLPFKPTTKELYFFVDIAASDGIKSYYFNNDSIDKRIIATIPVFGTEKEAIAERNKQDWWKETNKIGGKMNCNECICLTCTRKECRKQQCYHCAELNIKIPETECKFFTEEKDSYDIE